MDDIINQIKELKLELNKLNDKIDDIYYNKNKVNHNLYNRNKKWTNDEEQTLLNELNDNININDISKNHKRTVLAIECRIKKMILQDYYKSSLENLSKKFNLDVNYLQKILK